MTIWSTTWQRGQRRRTKIRPTKTMKKKKRLNSKRRRKIRRITSTTSGIQSSIFTLSSCTFFVNRNTPPHCIRWLSSSSMKSQRRSIRKRWETSLRRNSPWTQVNLNRILVSIPIQACMIWREHLPTRIATRTCSPWWIYIQGVQTRITSPIIKSVQSQSICWFLTFLTLCFTELRVVSVWVRDWCS